MEAVATAATAFFTSLLAASSSSARPLSGELICSSSSRMKEMIFPVSEKSGSFLRPSMASLSLSAAPSTSASIFFDSNTFLASSMAFSKAFRLSSVQPSVFREDASSSSFTSSSLSMATTRRKLSIMTTSDSPKGASNRSSSPSFSSRATGRSAQTIPSPVFPNLMFSTTISPLTLMFRQRSLESWLA